MLGTFLILLALIVAGALIYLATREGSYEVCRTWLINSNIDAVFDKLRDFKTWADWSPWLMHEPDCRLTFSDVCDEEGGHYSWDGRRVGAGTLTHVKLDRPNHIQERIEFTRPFKSVCDVAFELAEKDGETEVVWTMRGTMPFLFRFMTKKTKDMIGKDYDLGLAMLAGQLDPDAEAPRIEFNGAMRRAVQHCLCKGFEGDIEAMEAAMQAGFPELMRWVEENDGRLTGQPLTVYHKVSAAATEFVCDMALPVADDLAAGNYALKDLGGGKYYETTLHGSYRFLELAWYSAMAHVKMLKLKYDWQRPSIEVYENDPGAVSHTNELQTTIYVPIK